MNEKFSVEELEKDLHNELHRWNTLYNFGGNDPSWPDGVNLNLVRNHILYLVEKLDAARGEETQLSFFESSVQSDTQHCIPSKVEDSYMAQPEQIRAEAAETLRLLQEDPDVDFVRWCNLDERAMSILCVRAYRGYLFNLENAIENDDLVTMRRYRNSEYWLDTFRNESKRISQYLEIH